MVHIHSIDMAFARGRDVNDLALHSLYKRRIFSLRVNDNDIGIRVYPSIELFIQLITMFDISVDEYIFPNKEVKKSSIRRRIDAQLDNLDDRELSVIEAIVNGLCKAKEPEE